MRTLRKRLQQAAIVFTLALCVAAGVAFAEYLRRGGDTAALADAILRTAQGEGMPRASSEGAHWEIDWSGALDAVHSARGWLLKRVPAQADEEDGLELPGIIEPGLDEPGIIEPDLDAAVRVYFGPVEPGMANGMKRALLDLIGSADETLFVAAFTLGHEGIAEALIARHEAGVRVGVVSDSDYRDDAAMQQVLAAGIPVVFDERSAYMHNKFVIVDGHTVWTGSANLTDNGFFFNRNNAITVRSRGLAENYTAEFKEMYRDGLFGPRSPPGVPNPVLHVGSVKVRTLFAPEDDVIAAITDEMHGARNHIEFMAYAFSCEHIAGAMASGLERGVAVRGLFERVHAARDWSRDDYLAARGAEVFVCASPGKMHHKVIVVDRELVMTGSYNFSRSAAESNDENVVLLRCAEIAARYVEELDRLVLDAEEGPF